MTGQPFCNGIAHQRQLAFEKVVGVLDQHELLWLGSEFEDFAQIGGWCELIVVAADHQFRLGAICEVGICVKSFFDRQWSSKRNKTDYALIGAAGFQSCGSPKRKSGKDDWLPVFPLEPIECSANIVALAASIVVGALAESGAAKVESEDRKTEGVERLGGVIHNLVVHRSSMQRMRMADERCVRSIGVAGIQQSFEASCGASDEQGLDRVRQKSIDSILAGSSARGFRDFAILLEQFHSCWTESARFLKSVSTVRGSEWVLSFEIR
jgi:hypothetical protein